MRCKVFAALFLVLLAATARAEAPAHYDLRAHIDPQAATIDAQLVVDLPASEAQAQSSFVLGERFTVTSVDAGADATVEVTKVQKPIAGLQALTIRAKPGKPAPRRVRIVYKGPLNPPKDGSPVVAASPERVELFVDSMWLPIRDDLGLLYAVDAEITGLPADMTVVGPGEASRSGGVARFRRTFADIDFAFVAARNLQRLVEGDVEIYARDLDGPYVTAYRRHAARALSYYVPWFGPVPHAPIRLVVVSRSEGPGYARRGYIVVSERGMQKAPDEDAAAGFIGHEFAHAWWNVGGPTTEDYWMSESMASYVSLRYREQIGRPASAPELAEVRKKLRDIGPILGSGRPSGEAVYGKGPILLLDLEARVGRPAMDRILGELTRSPPRTTADFLAKVTEVSGPEASRAFEAALRLDGYPH